MNIYYCSVTIKGSQEGSETWGSDLCVEGALAMSMADKQAGPTGGDPGGLGSLVGHTRMFTYLCLSRL